MLSLVLILPLFFFQDLTAQEKPTIEVKSLSLRDTVSVGQYLTNRVTVSFSSRATNISLLFPSSMQSRGLLTLVALHPRTVYSERDSGTPRFDEMSYVFQASNAGSLILEAAPVLVIDVLAGTTNQLDIPTTRIRVTPAETLSIPLVSLLIVCGIAFVLVSIRLMRKKIFERRRASC
jgi:hypothetical protein